MYFSIMLRIGYKLVDKNRLRSQTGKDGKRVGFGWLSCLINMDWALSMKQMGKSLIFNHWIDVEIALFTFPFVKKYFKIYVSTNLSNSDVVLEN